MVMLHSRERGQGEPLVLLHGLFGSGDNLGGIARQLEDDYTVISMDLRNHGRSPHASSISYQAMADDVIETMENLNVPKAAIFGHSMGGKVAMQLALTASGVVTKLIVADIAPVAYGRNHDGILEGMRAVKDAAPQSRDGAQDILNKFVKEPDVLSFLMTNWRRLENGRWGWRINLDVVVNKYQDIAAAPEGKPYQGPTLFIRGGNSDYIRPEHRDAILALFPQATVKTVEGTGHWLHAEKPDLVARVVSRFLEND